MSQVKGNTGNSFSKFFFAHEFRVMLSEIPDYRRNVIHSLVIGYENAGPVYRNVVFIFNRKAGTKNVKAPH